MPAKGRRSRKWTFTLYIHDEHGNGINKLRFLTDRDVFVPLTTKFDEADYLVYQYEITEKDTEKVRGDRLHIQGYVVFPNARTLGGVKKIIEKWSGERGPHLEASKGNSLENKEYCTKEDTRVDGPYEFGLCPLGDDKADLLVAFNKFYETGLTMELIQEYPTYMTQYNEKWKRMKLELKKKEFKKDKSYRKPKVIVLWGVTGKGKTSPAVEDGGIFYNYDNKDGPLNHGDPEEDDVLILDEFTGQIPIGKLKMLLDGYRVMEKILYVGNVHFRFKKIYITSQFHPKQWYGGKWNPTDYEAFMRRIHHIKEFTHQDPDPIYVDDVRTNPYIIPDLADPPEPPMDPPQLVTADDIFF